MSGEKPFEIRVVCYAGYRGEETPRHFYLGKRKIVIEEIIDRWLAPDHRYFKVRSAAGDIYILRFSGRNDRWELTLFESRDSPDLKPGGR